METEALRKRGFKDRTSYTFHVGVEREGLLVGGDKWGGGEN